MSQRSAVIAAAWLEIVVGAILLSAPGAPCLLLFAARPDGIAIPLARFAGIALAALGIACLPTTAIAPPRNALLGLFGFNLGAASLFVWVGVSTAWRGLLLWPGAALHAVIAIALLPLVTKKAGFAAHNLPLEENGSRGPTK